MKEAIDTSRLPVDSDGDEREDSPPGDIGAWFDDPSASTTRPATSATSKTKRPAQATPKEKPRTQAELAAAIGKERYDFGSYDGRCWAIPKPECGPYLVRPIRHGSLRSEIAAEFSARHDGKVPSNGACSDALNVLEGIALQNEIPEPHLRIARHDGDVIVDMGRIDGHVIRITPAGWDMLDRSPILFRRTKLIGEMPLPERGGSVAMLRELLNVTDESWPLLIGWLVACLIPDMPHPIALLTGEQGTGKTTAAKMLTSLVDPSPAPVTAPPENIRDWAVAAAACWTIVVDNLSTIRPWFSDALCRAATGDGLLTREMYTDAEVSVLSFRRCIMLTSIDAGALRGDLAERLATIELERLSRKERRTDREIQERFAQARSKIFGALLDIAVKVLAELPNVRLEEMPRMADFEVVLAAVDTVMGTNSREVFAAHAKSLASDVVDGDPVASAIRGLMADRDTWSGTAQELLATLVKPEALHPKYWPSDGRRLANQVRKAAAALEQVGVDAQGGKSNGKRLWNITRLPNYVHQVVTESTENAPPPAVRYGGVFADEPF